MKKKLAIFLIFLIFAGCNILDTRDPEDPESRRTGLTVAADPDQLFENFINSLKNKVLENYTASFADTLFIDDIYRFVPSAGSVSQFPALADWGIEEEREYFREVISASADNIPIVLTFTGEKSNQAVDSALYEYHYMLNLTLSDREAPDVYAGTLRFTIKRDDREQWVITEWTDIKSEDKPSWSELKGQYY